MLTRAISEFALNGAKARKFYSCLQKKLHEGPPESLMTGIDPKAPLASGSYRPCEMQENSRLPDSLAYLTYVIRVEPRRLIVLLRGTRSGGDAPLFFVRQPIPADARARHPESSHLWRLAPSTFLLSTVSPSTVYVIGTAAAVGLPAFLPCPTVRLLPAVRFECSISHDDGSPTLLRSLLEIDGLEKSSACL